MSGKRGAGYSDAEREALADLVLEFREIIECKTTDKTTRQAKEQAWDTITHRFNAEAVRPDVLRNKTSLQSQYGDMKDKAKKGNTAFRKEVFLTGGGKRKVPELSSQHEKVLAVSGARREPLPNKYDSDAKFHMQISGILKSKSAKSGITSKEQDEQDFRQKMSATTSKKAPVSVVDIENYFSNNPSTSTSAVLSCDVGVDGTVYIDEEGDMEGEDADIDLRPSTPKGSVSGVSGTGVDQSPIVLDPVQSQPLSRAPSLCMSPFLQNRSSSPTRNVESPQPAAGTSKDTAKKAPKTSWFMQNRPAVLGANRISQGRTNIERSLVEANESFAEVGVKRQAQLDQSQRIEEEEHKKRMRNYDAEFELLKVKIAVGKQKLKNLGGKIMDIIP